MIHNDERQQPKHQQLQNHRTENLSGKSRTRDEFTSHKIDTHKNGSHSTSKIFHFIFHFIKAIYIYMNTKICMVDALALHPMPQFSQPTHHSLTRKSNRKLKLLVMCRIAFLHTPHSSVYLYRL